MSKHTPGPWATYRDQLSVGEVHGHSSICEVWERRGGQGFENARLIAAAPELLEALDGMIKAYDDGVQPEWALPYIHAAHAAIAKAK